MSTVIETKEFANLNVGVALDEGLASPDDSFTVFYGERVAWCKLHNGINSWFCEFSIRTCSPFHLQMKLKIRADENSQN